MGKAESSPTVRTPRRESVSTVRSPAPHSAAMGSGSKNSWTRPARTTMTPSGLARLVASLATNLVGATPTEQVMPRFPCTSARIRAAMRGGSPNRRTAPPTSRNASSSDMGSTSGVWAKRISRNRLE